MVVPSGMAVYASYCLWSPRGISRFLVYFAQSCTTVDSIHIFTVHTRLKTGHEALNEDNLLPLSTLLSDPAREPLRDGRPTLGTKDTHQFHHLSVLLSLIVAASDVLLISV